MNKKTGIKSLTINEKKWCRMAMQSGDKFCAAGFLAKRMGLLPVDGDDDAVYNKLSKVFGLGWRLEVATANDYIARGAERKAALRKLFAQKGIKLRFVNGKGGKK